MAKGDVDFDSLAVTEFDSEDERVADSGDEEDEIKLKEDEDAVTFNKKFKFDEGDQEDVNDWDFMVDKKESGKDGESVAVGENGKESSAAHDSGDEEEDEDEDEDEEEEEEENDNEDSDEDENQQSTELTGIKGKASEVDEDSAEALAEFFEETKVSGPQKDSETTFTNLQLSRPILRALADLNYVKPTPIQKESIPVALMGRDVVAGAETGSGKTAAYIVPILERLLYKPTKINKTRVIVLTPTRELSIQVFDVVKKLTKYCGNVTLGMAIGGLNLRQQEQQLRSKPDIVIATPGRFIDHVRNSPSFSVDSVEVLVMDEADRMLEEGFQKELTEILGLLPSKRQTMLFSATMNSKIQTLIQLSLQKPVRIMVNSPNQAATKLTQEFVRVRKREAEKPAMLYHVLQSVDPKQHHRIVVFVARKETASKLRRILQVMGRKAGELHGALTQEQRLTNVTGFKTLSLPVLICTDLAARGLDIPKIEYVINYDMPKSYEIYLHRVGRTARANRDGKSISFVGESSSDRSIVKDALKSLGELSKKAVSRQVDWKDIEKISKQMEQKSTQIEDLEVEEKQRKELEIAERDLRKAENLMKHSDEIKSRPRRTWFEDSKDSKNNAGKRPKKINSKKRKRMGEDGKGVNFGKAAKKQLKRK